MALAAGGLVLLLAPPASNYFWAVNGLRSLPGPEATTLLLVSAATALAVFATRRGAAWAAFVAVSLAILVAYPLRESIHFLGDTQLRLRSMAAFGEGIVLSPFAEWASGLHANPLDIALDLVVPVTLVRMGWPLRDGVSLTSAALAIVYIAGLWRIARRVGAPAPLRLPLALALGLTGTLEAFAGYAESAGLVAALTAWWWAEALAPLSGRGQALRLSLAWVAVLLGHRLGAVLLLPMVWRAVGPAWEGDRSEARRWLLGATAAIAVVGAGLMLATPAGRQVGLDLREMLFTLRRLQAEHMAPSDWANALALVAPLAWFAPFVAGRAEVVTFARGPLFGMAMTLVVPLLLALMFVFPYGGSNLGTQRDWDLNVILGLSLSVLAAALVARLPAARLRPRLAWVLPVLAIGSLGFVAVQADESAAERRAQAVAEQPPRMPDAQISHAHLYLGQRAMDHGQYQPGARHFERSFELNPNPRRALLAAEAWIASGDHVAARRALERARARGRLDPGLADAARRIEAILAPPPAAGSPGGRDSSATGR